MNELFISWSKIANIKYNSLLLTAASAFCWAIWITKNKWFLTNVDQNFFAATSQGNALASVWARLQRHDDLRDLLTLVGQHLETSALQFFSSNGWLSTGHIGHV
jgi:hypothetical protein